MENIPKILSKGHSVKHYNNANNSPNMNSHSQFPVVFRADADGTID